MPASSSFYVASGPEVSASVRIPASLEIAIAVTKLSPVTILTLIPASYVHFSIDYLTPGLRGSLIPEMRIIVIPPSSAA